MADNTPSPSPHTNRKKSRRSKHDGECRMVGNWEIGKTIGRGSSGRVKIAQHIETKQRAAIKIVSKHALITSRMSINHADEQQEKIMLGIEREIVLMKLIDHPNVLSLYDVYETSNDLYLIIEYVEGGELFEYLVSRGRLPVDEALHYFQQIISAMDYCHSFNIAHRDLKPEYLLPDRHKNIKVADFGMAAWEGGTGMLETSCGSPHYASPEVVQGKAYRGCTSDIWSCGVILFALLAGRLPFDDGNIRALLEKVKTGKYTMPSDTPLAAKDLIRRMLEKNVDQRITMKEILRHPFFTSRAPRPLPGGGISPAPPSLQEVTRPVSSVGEIDPDIFGNLKTLWHGAPEEEIIAGLMGSEKTWEKAVYHLLLKYRARRLEDYDEEPDATRVKEKIAEKRMLPPPVAPVAPTVPGPPISPRKQQSPPVNFKAAPGPEPIVITKPAPPSTTTAPLRLNQPAGPRPLPSIVPIPATRNHTSLGTPTIQIQTATPEKTTTTLGPPPPVPAKNIPPPLNLAPRSPLHSPIISFTPAAESPGLPPIEVPDLGDPNMQRFFRQIVEHLSIMQPRSPIAASDDGRSGASSMGSGSERMSARHSRGGTSGYSSQVEDDGDASRFADADEEYYATDVEGYASSTGGGSIRSASTSRTPRNMTQNSPGSNRHSYHQPPVPPPKNETVRGGMVFRRLQSSRPPPPSLRGSAYGSPYHQNIHTHPLQSRVLSNRQSTHSTPPLAPPIPGRHRSYPVQGGYASEKENSIPPRATLSAGAAPRPSLKKAHSGGAGTIERQKSYGQKHVQIVLPGEEAKLRKKKSFSTIDSSGDSPFFVAPMEKRSWFGNLFKFKPASYHLLSVYDFATSRDECRRLLIAMDVQVTVENAGYLRCRFDEFRDPSGVMAVTKPVRFRVEAHGVGHAHTVAGYTTSVAMVQEKGALSTFKLLYNRLRRDWELDAPASILLKTPSNPGTSIPSPTLTASPGGRSPLLSSIY